jgi:hypothetical protein
MKPNPTERETHIYMARVFIAQAAAARRHSGWHATLLTWAANRAASLPRKQRQADLFTASQPSKRSLERNQHDPQPSHLSSR